MKNIKPQRLDVVVLEPHVKNINPLKLEVATAAASLSFRSGISKPSWYTLSIKLSKQINLQMVAWSFLIRVMNKMVRQKSTGQQNESATVLEAA